MRPAMVVRRIYLQGQLSARSDKRTNAYNSHNLSIVRNKAKILSITGYSSLLLQK